jgi:hypothetical protein
MLRVDPQRNQRRQHYQAKNQLIFLQDFSAPAILDIS